MISAVIKYEDNKVSIHSSATKEVGTKFNSGFYDVHTDSEGNMHIYERFLQEIHDPFKTMENELTVETIKGFFTDGIEKKVKQLGFIHKLGILLFGKAGTGKTSLLHFVAKRLAKEKEAIVFFCNTQNHLGSGIRLAQMIREIQDNPIVFIADEFERYAKEMESEMKNFLDGNDSINNTLFLAATNYIDKVPETLKNRPSRFKVVKEIKGITDKKLMREIVKNISDRIQPGLFTDKEIEQELFNTHDITLDEIKHICLNKVTNSYLPKQVIRNTIGFKREEDTIEQLTSTGIISGFWDKRYSDKAYNKITEETSV